MGSGIGGRWREPEPGEDDVTWRHLGPGAAATRRYPASSGPPCQLLLQRLGLGLPPYPYYRLLLSLRVDGILPTLQVT